MEFFGILFQEAQKAPRILAVDQGNTNNRPQVFATARLGACLGGILEYLALYMFFVLNDLYRKFIFQVFVSEVDFACILKHFDQNGTGAIYISLNTQSISF